MDYKRDRTNTVWETLTMQEKNHQLYFQQKDTLDTFLQHGAITKEQHEKSLHDLWEKMGENL